MAVLSPPPGGGPLCFKLLNNKLILLFLLFVGLCELPHYLAKVTKDTFLPVSSFLRCYCFKEFFVKVFLEFFKNPLRFDKHFCLF